MCNYETEIEINTISFSLRSIEYARTTSTAVPISLPIVIQIGFYVITSAAHRTRSQSVGAVFAN